jgi:hypothetical protein
MKMTGNKNNLKAVDLSQKINNSIMELSQMTDEARFSEKMLEYLNTCSKFYKYSANNQWLIHSFNPGATYVAGFQRWKKMSRFVMKGERGIPILCPVIYKEDVESDESKKVIRGFKTAYVFDISQTTGKDLPSLPEWRSLDRNEMLQNKLIHYAGEKGIVVTIEELPGDIQGLSKGGDIQLSPNAGTKTLIHELAHEIMHQGANRTNNNKRNAELEAEAVAYVVSKHFGLQNLESPNYLALHGANTDLIKEHMERIKEVSSEIITSIEDE